MPIRKSLYPHPLSLSLSHTHSSESILFMYFYRLRLVFNWLMSAFSSHLCSHEVLLLWDRIVGHDSLSVVAVMAVAVMEFRSSNLFKATSCSEAEVCSYAIYYAIHLDTCMTKVVYEISSQILFLESNLICYPC